MTTKNDKKETLKADLNSINNNSNSVVEARVMLLAGKYWHELTDEEVQSLFDAGVTYGWLLENIKQPDWCEYPDALQGEFGCTSLVLLDYRKGISKEYCKNCDCYRKST